MHATTAFLNNDKKLFFIRDVEMILESMKCHDDFDGFLSWIFTGLLKNGVCSHMLRLC